MSSIVTAVFKATIGLLVNKGRDKAAEKLKDGDVTDQRFRGLIVRELEDIKSKLDGLSRKDLLASISFFEEGIELLYEAFDKARLRSECGREVTVQAACAETFSLAEKVKHLELTGLDKSTIRVLANAKERFKDSRKEATRAFENEALETSDRILAMHYRLMATVLETVDNPTDALAPCRVCIKELNCLPAVQNSFDIQLKKGIKAARGLFSKKQRRKIISSVCQVNRVMYDVTQALGKDAHLWVWPFIDTGADKIDPLRDGRLTKILHEQSMEHCCVKPWSFGQEGEEGHRLRQPWGIATNSSGHFIIADYGDSDVKVFDSSGNFMNKFSPPNDSRSTKLYIHDVATDKKENIYVLVEERKIGSWGYEGAGFVYVFNPTASLHHKFPLRKGEWYRLSVSDRCKVLVLGDEPGGSQAMSVIDVYEGDGQFVRSIRDGFLWSGRDITAANDGRVAVTETVLDHDAGHVFSDYGDYLQMIRLREECVLPYIAFHRKTEHYVVVGKEKRKLGDRLFVTIHTKDGDFVRSILIDEDDIGYFIAGTAVTIDGRILVILQHLFWEGKVLVI